MAGTLIFDVRQALVTGLAGLDAFTTKDAKGHRPLTTVGWPTGKRDREKVYTQRARFSHAPASMRAGRMFRNESGTFELVIWIEGVGESVDWTSARAVQLGTAAEEWIADNRTLGGTLPGLNWLVVEGDGDLTELFNDGGSLCFLTYPIKYDARLT